MAQLAPVRFRDLADDLALSAARVLGKYGSRHADYTEWHELKNALLAIQPVLSKDVASTVGGECSGFIEALRGTGALE